MANLGKFTVECETVVRTRPTFLRCRGVDGDLRWVNADCIDMVKDSRIPGRCVVGLVSGADLALDIQGTAEEFMSQLNS